MNARAYDLVVQLRAILRSLPGATSIALHASEVWTLALITASSDEAVIALSEELGLGGPEVRSTAGRWRHRASAERDRDTLRVVVAGPDHKGPPPGDET